MNIYNAYIIDKLLFSLLLAIDVEQRAIVIFLKLPFTHHPLKVPALLVDVQFSDASVEMAEQR